MVNARTPHLSRVPTLTRRLAPAAVLLAALSLVPAAHGAATTIVGSGGPLSAPGDAITTPDGGLWLVDGVAGVCRLALAPTPHLVEDGAWCGAAVHGGPKKPMQMAFDPAASSFYASDAASTAPGVWRLHWNAATGTIDAGARIVDTGANRVFGVALAPGGAVDFTGRADAVVRRISDPAGASPTVSAIGVSLRAGAGSLARLGADLYLAESDGTVSRLTPATGASAQLVPGLPAAGALSGVLAADAANGRVYVGTHNLNGQDRVDVLTPVDGQISTYADGLSGITGLGLDDAGTLYVGDDPSGAAGGVGAVGQGRLARVPLGRVHLPVATITAGPPNPTRLAVADFSFTSRAGTLLQCRLDSALEADFASCGVGPAGSASYAGLGEGTHAFDVRAGEAADPTAIGPATRRTFVVDRTPPSVTVDGLSSQYVGGAGFAVRADFSANDFSVAFTCALDDAVPVPCASPRRLSGVAPGAHRLTIVGADPAGNESAPVVHSFQLTVPPPPPPPPSPAGSGSGTGSGSGSGSGGAPPTGDAPADDGGSTPQPPRGDDPGPSPAPSIVSDAAECHGIGPATEPGTVTSRRRGRLLVVHVRPPTGARYAGILLQGARPRDATTLRVARVWWPGKATTLRVRLNRHDWRLLYGTRGRHELRVAYGTCPIDFGAAQRLVQDRRR